MNRNFALSAATLAVALTSTAALGATTFTEDFSGLAQPSNMTQFLAGTPSYAGATAQFNGSGSRYYLGTNEVDYATRDFVFEGTVTLVSSGTNANGTAFFGMGGGTFNGSFGTPNTPAIYAEIGPQSFANGFVRFNDVDGTNTNSGTLGQGNGGWGNGSVHRVRLTWNALTQTALFELDQNYTGTFAANFSSSSPSMIASDNGFNGTNSRLYFGAGNGTQWDNISVVVAPAPAALPAGLGLIAFAAMRRSRRR